jgi:hypothetical protein
MGSAAAGADPEERDRAREALLPGQTEIAPVLVEAVASGLRVVDAPLVQFSTAAGDLASWQAQCWQVRRKGDRFGPFGNPGWIPACAVRVGDYVCRPRRPGPDLWLPITTVQLIDGPAVLYLYRTRAETITVNGFLARTEPAQA